MYYFGQILIILLSAQSLLCNEDNHNIPLGMHGTDSKCDNSEDNLAIDFDPDSYMHQSIYACHSTRYAPSYVIEPLFQEYIVPTGTDMPTYKCMNESITYDLSLRVPTYGNHRPNWPKYGEYIYVPIQRWLHTIQHGGIVMLYHPCADQNEIDKLKLIVKSCLYRHVITSSKRLLLGYPLALVAWGKSLEMSFVNSTIIVDFIRSNALRGPEIISENGQYDKLLIDNAKIVSDIDDSVICRQMIVN